MFLNERSCPMIMEQITNTGPCTIDLMVFRLSEPGLHSSSYLYIVFSLMYRGSCVFCVANCWLTGNPSVTQGSLARTKRQFVCLGVWMCLCCWGSSSRPGGILLNINAQPAHCSVHLQNATSEKNQSLLSQLM